MSEPQSYESAREELADVVRQLEAGGVSLEESLALWERGETLADRCERWLAGARARLAAAESQAETPAETPAETRAQPTSPPAAVNGAD